MLAPASRPLAFRLERTSVPFATRTIGSDTETLWESDLPAFAGDGDEPAWYEARPALVLSELSSWADVARWAADLYESSVPLSPGLAAKIREIREANVTDEARALAALRFVQDDVRYLGVELGEHSYRPHDPSSVFEQRFGDCKDKVLLLLTMLRGLGVEAHAALVNTDLAARLADELPRPQAFDHVIARLRIGGGHLWVDATKAMERGPLGSVPGFHGRALVVSRDTTDLAIIDAAQPSEPWTTVNEVFRVKGESALLDVTTTYRSARADSARHSLATTARSETKSSYLEFYAKRFPSIEPVGELRVEDDEAKNVLVVREAYRLPTAVTHGQLGLWAHALASAAAAPGVTRRSSPLAVANPIFVRHEIEIETDGAEVALPEHKGASDASLTFTMQAERRPHGIRAVFQLQSHADSVPLAEVPQHLEVLQTIRTGIDQELTLGPPANESGARRKDEDLLLGLAAVALVLVSGVVALVALARRARAKGRRWFWLRRGRPDAGQVPAKAIRIRSREEGERRILQGAWACDHASPAPGAIIWSTVSFAGRSVSAARVTCRSCAESRVCYFVVDDGAHERAE